MFNSSKENKVIKFRISFEMVKEYIRDTFNLAHENKHTFGIHYIGLDRNDLENGCERDIEDCFMIDADGAYYDVDDRNHHYFSFLHGTSTKRNCKIDNPYPFLKYAGYETADEMLNKDFFYQILNKALQSCYKNITQVKVAKIELEFVD